MVKCDFKNDPWFHIQEKAPVRYGWTGLWLPVLHLLSSSCFLTFIKPSGSSPSTPSCSKALELSQSSATLFLLVCPTGKPSNEGPAHLCFALLGRDPPTVCCPQGCPDGVWPGLDSPHWCKTDPRKAAQHAIRTRESKWCPSFPKWSIWSHKQHSSCMYTLKILTEANSPA